MIKIAELTFDKNNINDSKSDKSNKPYFANSHRKINSLKDLDNSTHKIISPNNSALIPSQYEINKVLSEKA